MKLPYFPTRIVSVTILFGLCTAFAENPSTSVLELGSAQPMNPNNTQVSIETEGDALVISAPNFWTASTQINKMKWSLPIPSDSRLFVKASGDVGGQDLLLEVRLVSDDWARASVYHIPLMTIQAGEASPLLATTPVEKPLEENPLAEGESPANLQFIIKGTGHLPVKIALEEIGFEPGE